MYSNATAAIIWHHMCLSSADGTLCIAGVGGCMLPPVHAGIACGRLMPHSAGLSPVLLRHLYIAPAWHHMDCGWGDEFMAALVGIGSCSGRARELGEPNELGYLVRESPRIGRVWDSQ